VILADTTVWIDFLAGRASALPLRSLLASNRVVCHPAVRGEIALGSIAKRDDVLRLLSQLPSAPVAGDDEVFALIESKKLSASGIGGLVSWQMAALTTAQLGAFNTTQIAALSTTGVGGLTTAEIASLSATAATALTVTQLQSLTTDQLQALTTSDIATLSTTALSALTIDTFDRLTSTQMASLSTTGIAALTVTLLQALSETELRRLTATEVSGLTSTQVAALSTSAIATLSTTQLVALTKTAIDGMTAAQVATFSTTQLAALTPNQISGLSATAVTGLNQRFARGVGGVQQLVGWMGIRLAEKFLIQPHDVGVLLRLPQFGGGVNIHQHALPRFQGAQFFRHRMPGPANTSARTRHDFYEVIRHFRFVLFGFTYFIKHEFHIA